MLIEPRPAQRSGELALLADEAREYADEARSLGTMRVYHSTMRAFGAWCSANCVAGLPATPETLSLYIAHLAKTLRPATIANRVAAISVAHTLAGYETPTQHGVVKAVMTGMRKRLGIAQTQKEAITVKDLRAMVTQCDTTLGGARDRALLLIGFASAMRRSELVALRCQDVRPVPEGVILTLLKSKTNQLGQREEIAIPYGSDPNTCPVRAVQAWIVMAGHTDGPLFRHVTRHQQLRGGLTPQTVKDVVKKLAARAKIGDPRKYGGHSLRAGFATSAARAGKTEAAIMRQGRWRSQMVARRYVRQGTIWDDHAAIGIGL